MVRNTCRNNMLSTGYRPFPKTLYIHIHTYILYIHGRFVGPSICHTGQTQDGGLIGGLRLDEHQAGYGATTCEMWASLWHHKGPKHRTVCFSTNLLKSGARKGGKREKLSSHLNSLSTGRGLVLLLEWIAEQVLNHSGISVAHLPFLWQNQRISSSTLLHKSPRWKRFRGDHKSHGDSRHHTGGSRRRSQPWCQTINTQSLQLCVDT